MRRCPWGLAAAAFGLAAGVAMGAAGSAQAPVPLPPAGGHAPAGAAPSTPFVERAHQDREIVYFLQQPETHAFDLYHDYTEARVGIGRYLNVVRRGSTASRPAAINLDTGEPLPVVTLHGEEAARAAQEEESAAGGQRPEDRASEVVVVQFPALRQGESIRLRISETYTDAASYAMAGDELVFDRSFGRPRNAVVLPAGWYLTASSIPATVSETPDGRIRLDFVNPRPDEIHVVIKARRRPGV